MLYVEDVDRFVKVFKQRLKDCEVQRWRTDKQNVQKLYYYNMFKTEFNTEKYIQLNLPRKYVSAIANFRMSSHQLAIETGRHANIPRKDRLCKLCKENSDKTAVECEFHFLLVCELYDSLRKLHLSDFVSTQKTIFNFVKIMKCPDEHVIHALSKYLYSSFLYRDALLD